MTATPSYLQVGNDATTANNLVIKNNDDGTAAIQFGTPGSATTALEITPTSLLFSTATGFGIYYGSGVPSLSAGQGSVYFRSDGASSNTRMYVNANGTTGWTAVLTSS